MRGWLSLGSSVLCFEIIRCYSLSSLPPRCQRQHVKLRLAASFDATTSAANNDVATSPTNNTAGSSSSTSDKTPTETNDAALLLQQAKALREQASSMKKALNESLIEKARREEEKIDRWIDELLISYKVDDRTEMLRTVDQAVERLQQDRYSQEQINKIFKRLCEVGPKQSRSSHSPLMALLVESVGKMDDLERKDNPNKRWSGRVEQALQKKLFAADWNIELEDEEEQNRWNPFKLP